MDIVEARECVTPTYGGDGGPMLCNQWLEDFMVVIFFFLWQPTVCWFVVLLFI